VIALCTVKEQDFQIHLYQGLLGRNLSSIMFTIVVYFYDC